jgi:hypothetical protein
MPDTPDRDSSRSSLSVRWLWIVLGLSAAVGIAKAVGEPLVIVVAIVVNLVVLYLVVRLMPRAVARAFGRIFRRCGRIVAACASWSWRRRWWGAAALIALAAFLSVRRAVLTYRVEQHYRTLVERGCLLPADKLSEIARAAPQDLELSRAVRELCTQKPFLGGTPDHSELHSELCSLRNALCAGINLETNLAAADRHLAMYRPTLDRIGHVLRKFPNGAPLRRVARHLEHALRGRAALTPRAARRVPPAPPAAP